MDPQQTCAALSPGSCFVVRNTCTASPRTLLLHARPRPFQTYARPGGGAGGKGGRIAQHTPCPALPEVRLPDPDGVCYGRRRRPHYVRDSAPSLARAPLTRFCRKKSDIDHWVAGVLQQHVRDAAALPKQTVSLSKVQRSGWQSVCIVEPGSQS